MNNFKKRGKSVERAFKGVWISKEIWLDAHLTWMEKLFITEINSLDNDKGCFASNKHFSEFFKMSNGRCSQIIHSLIDKKYLSVSYIMKGKQILKRTLKVLNEPIKNSKKGIKDSKEGYLESDKDNNTLFNNTTNNIYKKKSFSRDNY